MKGGPLPRWELVILLHDVVSAHMAVVDIKATLECPRDTTNTSLTCNSTQPCTKSCPAMLRSVVADLLQRASDGYANHTIVDVDVDRSMSHHSPRVPLQPLPKACSPSPIPIVICDHDQYRYEQSSSLPDVAVQGRCIWDRRRRMGRVVPHRAILSAGT